VNVKEYISSGIVESYVLGLLSETEQQEFEANVILHTEIARAKESFELSLERALLLDAAPPPVFLKEQIRASLFSNGNNNLSVAGGTNPHDNDAPGRGTINKWKWLAAASVLLLAGSLYWGITTNNKYNDLKVVALENKRLQQELAQKNQQLTEVERDAFALQQPGMKMTSLKGTTVSPASYVTVYWDTTNKDVYLMVNNLPKPASEKQYQLWAIINGKPVDLGLLEVNERKLIPMIKMKGVQNAEAFAITLEPKGGSQNPTMDQMYVVGKL
jgi:anti-sigma-K factor RskA